MLISCKCFNFIATSSVSSNQLQLQRQKLVEQQENLHSEKKFNGSEGVESYRPDGTTADLGFNRNNVGTADEEIAISLASLVDAFLQKYPRNFAFYSQCVEFFKHAVGPVRDITITSLNQKDLIYSLTIFASSTCNSAWQINICINCNTALYAKRISLSLPLTSLQHNSNAILSTDASYGVCLLNSALFTNNEELTQRKSDTCYSETFEILIMDKQSWKHNSHTNAAGQLSPNDSTSPTSPTITSSTKNESSPADDVDNSRSIIFPLINSKQNRLKNLTQTLQARLKKEIADTDERIMRYTEQQFALLKSFREKSEQEYQTLVNLINADLDELPELNGANADINGSIHNHRNKNTIGSRRGTADLSATPNTSILMLATNSSTSAIENTQSHPNQQVHQTGSNFTFNNRKITHYDTPPATPESTPMSIGNSPTFRQQFPTSIDSGDGFFFELEGVDDSCYQMQCADPNENADHGHNNNEMSDLDEDDDAEEAEDALNLESTIPIPHRQRNLRFRPRASGFGKSLPINIENNAKNQPPVASDTENDLLYDNVDIAASIKALAKSVHGETVFGDLPRPRLRSQI